MHAGQETQLGLGTGSTQWHWWNEGREVRPLVSCGHEEVLQLRGRWSGVVTGGHW